MRGFRPILDFEEEDRQVGVALEHPSGVILGFHLDPRRAAALEGFSMLGLNVTDLAPWILHLDALGIEHSDVIDGHLGHCVQATGPDGYVIELHSADQPSALET